MAPKRLTSSRPSLAQALLLAAVLTAPLVGSSRAALPPGAAPCSTTGTPAGYGTFTLLRHADFTQSSPTALATNGALASIELLPPALYSISNAIVSGPGTFKATLTRQPNGSSVWSTTGTEAALAAQIPAGVGSVSFQLGFTNGDSFIGFFPFALANSTPPTPQLSNFDAAQSVAPQSPFSIAWNPWTGVTTNDRVNLTLTDASGTVVFSAASDCTGQLPIAVTDLAVTIPAGALAPNSTFTGYLTFGASLGGGTDDSTQILQRTFASRSTRFTLETTAGGSGSGSPGTLQGPQLSGTNLVFTLKGSPGDQHRIESTTDFATWSRELEVTLPASGSIEVTLPAPTGDLPKFYRAVALGSTTPTTGPANLGILLAGPRDLDIHVSGTPGATYHIELTFDAVVWTRIASTTILSTNTPSVVRVTVPEDQNFALVRAVAAAAPPPPVELKAPTLSTTLTNSGFGNAVPALRIGLTGGTPRRIYTVEQRSTASGATWVSSTQTTIATDANGNGSLLMIIARTIPVPGGTVPNSSGFLYRAVIR